MLKTMQNVFHSLTEGIWTDFFPDMVVHTAATIASVTLVKDISHPAILRMKMNANSVAKSPMALIAPMTINCSFCDDMYDVGQ